VEVQFALAIEYGFKSWKDMRDHVRSGKHRAEVMETMRLKPIRRVDGEVLLPGSKSISNRVLLLSALASGTTNVRNLLQSDDIERMIEALTALQVQITASPRDRSCRVVGNGGPISSSGAELYLGNAGTAMRPLCAALSLGKGDFVLRGNARMCERPIGDLVDALRQAGADITYLADEGFPPLRVTAKGLAGGRICIQGNISSQFLSSILLASPLARKETIITVAGDLVSRPYIDITLDVMRRFGVIVENRDYSSFIVPQTESYISPSDFYVEGDASSASYFLSAGAIRGGTVKVHGVGSRSVQGDIAHADVLEAMGATVRRGESWIEVTRGELRGIDIDCANIPDAAMTIAATALFADGPTRLRNIYNWRLKETDRLAAMTKELTKLGATVSEGRDFIVIEPPDTIRPATIDTYDDHRMAMSLSLAALGDAEITIVDPGCVSKTFPDFFDKLRSIVQE
jgi:3-phosphoshikimate 1-carboxyvinyltransferase